MSGSAADIGTNNSIVQTLIAEHEAIFRTPTAGAASPHSRYSRVVLLAAAEASSGNNEGDGWEQGSGPGWGTVLFDFKARVDGELGVLKDRRVFSVRSMGDCVCCVVLVVLVRVSVFDIDPSYIQVLTAGHRGGGARGLPPVLAG